MIIGAKSENNRVPTKYRASEAGMGEQRSGQSFVPRSGALAEADEFPFCESEKLIDSREEGVAGEEMSNLKLSFSARRDGGSSREGTFPSFPGPP